MGTPAEERLGIPFTDGVMADELPVNCRTPAIAKYNGTTDPQEHLSRFENATLLHRYTDSIKPSLHHNYCPVRAAIVQPVTSDCDRKFLESLFSIPTLIRH
ncbi:UNVERIFIED_CONTAM: hypothetical protein Sangu_2462600 [Sesamum angustifolium]|uniref:Uncharacterized protein n=1 Tax=Sesamum angustifolium TaxID=2727405 RepID=A0AAW2JTM5_9LAMI